MKTTKPLLEDKLVTWKRAYDAILDEMSQGFVMPPPRSGPVIVLTGSGQLVDLRCAAARTAAILIQGVEHEPR